MDEFMGRYASEAATLTFQLPADDKEAGLMTFAADGRTVAMLFPEQGTIRFVDAHTGRTVGAPLRRAPLGGAVTMAFSGDGRTLATANVDGTITLWDTPTRTSIGALSEGKATIGALINPQEIGFTPSMAFSSDGTLASVGMDGATRVWERLLWRSLPELEGVVCRIVGNGLSPTEWKQYARGVPFRRSCA